MNDDNNHWTKIFRTRDENKKNKNKKENHFSKSIRCIAEPRCGKDTAFGEYKRSGGRSVTNHDSSARERLGHTTLEVPVPARAVPPGIARPAFPKHTPKQLLRDAQSTGVP